VHKDIRIPPSPPPLPSHLSPVERIGQSIGSSVPSTAGIGGAGAFPAPPSLAPKTGVLRAEDEDARAVGGSGRTDGTESSDSAFMEDVCNFSTLVGWTYAHFHRRYAQSSKTTLGNCWFVRASPTMCSDLFVLLLDGKKKSMEQQQ
jgi:hypothetical protein